PAPRPLLRERPARRRALARDRPAAPGRGRAARRGTLSSAHHIALESGEAGRYALLPGDPGRVPLLAQRLDNAREAASNREYVSWNGELDGEWETVTPTGRSSPTAPFAVP